MNREGTLLLLSATSPTLLAGVGNYLAFPVTLIADSCVDKATEQALLDFSYLSGAVTGRTLAGLTPGFGT